LLRVIGSEANGGREQGFKRPGRIVSFLFERGFTLSRPVLRLTPWALLD
jgi:hypothetical protein